jgi:hypothetical protein
MGSAPFGPYRLVGVLSRGPSATVYRAHDTSHHDREVALKVFSRSLSADPAFRERFRRDAGLLSALREPHVVPIHRHGEIDGALYLDMRLVRGPSLAEALRAGPLDPTRARTIGQQIAAAGDALRRGGMGERPLDRGDVLLTGSPGREFVQLVGLGLGRPSAAAPPQVEALVGPFGGWAPPPTPRPGAPATRKRRVLVAAAALVTVAAVLAAVVVVTRSGWQPDEQPGADGPTGIVATITDTGGGVVAADTGELDGRRVLVTAAPDGGIHTWDLATGEAVRPPIPGDAFSLALTTLEGRTVAVARNRETAVRVLDLASGEPVGPAISVPATTAPDDPLGVRTRAVTTTVLDGGPVLITQLHTGATVPGIAGLPTPQIGLQPLGLPGGAPVAAPLAEEGQTISGSSVIEMNGRTVVVSIVGQKGLRARDLATGAPVGALPPPQPAGLLALTTAMRDGSPVALTGGADNTVRIWDLRTGEQLGPNLTGHTSAVAALTTVRLGPRTVVISSAASHLSPLRTEVRFWDLGTGAQIGGPLTEHPLAEGLVAVVEGDRPLLVAGRGTGPITVWDAQTLVEGGVR